MILFHVYSGTIIALILLSFVLVGYTPFLINSQDIFQASLAFLTFSSIFYGFTVAPGKQVIETVKSFYMNQKAEIQKKLQDLANRSETSHLSEELKRVHDKSKHLDVVLDSLNLNNFLFIGSLGYIFSILVYITRGADPPSYASALQVIFFILGVFCTLQISTSWFMANVIYDKELKKEN